MVLISDDNSEHVTQVLRSFLFQTICVDSLQENGRNPFNKVVEGDKLYNVYKAGLRAHTNRDILRKYRRNPSKKLLIVEFNSFPTQNKQGRHHNSRDV